MVDPGPLTAEGLGLPMADLGLLTVDGLGPLTVEDAEWLEGLGPLISEGPGPLTSEGLGPLTSGDLDHLVKGLGPLTLGLHASCGWPHTNDPTLH